MADDALPDEMVGTFHDFHDSLKSVEQLLQPYLATPLDEMYDMLSPIEQAKSELITAYTVNSLYWSFLTTQVNIALPLVCHFHFPKSTLS